MAERTMALLCLVFMLLLAPSVVDAQEYRLPVDSLMAGEPIALTQEFRLSVYDSAQFASPQYNASHWQTSVSMFESGDWPDGWNGFGWYRQWLIIPPELVGEPLAFRIGLLGAAEVYIDGELLLTVGQVGRSKEEESATYVDASDPIRIVFDSAGRHLVAVRHSSFEIVEEMPAGQSKGFMVSVAHDDLAGDWVRRHEIQTVRHQSHYTALALALAVIHLLLWLFYRPLSENRDFAVVAFFLAVAAYLPPSVEHAKGLADFIIRLKLAQFALIGVTLAVVHFIHKLFLRRLGIVFKVLAAIGIVLSILVITWPTWIGRHLFDLYVVIGFIETLRVIVLALRDNKSGARLIGIGFAVMVITSTISMFGFEIMHSVIGEYTRFLYMYGFGFLLLTMSIHLARNFATTNLRLKRQLEQVERLSQENLEQERQRLEEESRRELLEKDLEHQRKELEEARKLEQAMRELEATNRELRDTQAQLVQSEKMATLGQLVAGVSHEFNTPVGAVQSSNKNLTRAVERLNNAISDGGDEQEIARLAAIIEQSSSVIQSGLGRIDLIVQRLRNFARLDEAELKKVDIESSVQDVLNMLQGELEQEKIAIAVDNSIDRKVVCYPSLLNQAVMYIVRRAIAAAPKDGSRIDINAGRDNGRVVIRIFDSGKPISAGERNRIFDPAFAAEKGRMSMGLDLAIAFQIMQRHEGTITVDSDDDGTTFTLSFPDDLERRVQET